MMDDNHTLNLAQEIENLLPQTQCTKCGFNGCRPYAQAIAAGVANYNQCPPGGSIGIQKLAKLLNKPVIPLNPENGNEKVRHVAVIDENSCIGCTLCIQACPVDAIIGTSKHMHNILSDWCTGCDLCVQPCPVDCITMQEVSGINKDQTGWNSWSQQQADISKIRFYKRKERLDINKATQAEKNMQDNKKISADSNNQDKKLIIQAALERARAKKSQT